MSRAVLIAVLAFACGKGKDATVAHGSGSGSGSGSSGSGSAVVVTPAAPSLPVVSGQGTAPRPPAPRVMVTPTAIVVDGTQVLALAAGVPPADAVKDEKLPAIIDGLSAPSAAPRFVIAFDKAIDYRLLVQVLATLKTQGLKSYGLLAQTSGGETVMLPIDLPEPRPPEPAGKRAPGSDLQRQLDEVKKAGAEVKVGPSVPKRGPESDLQRQIDEARKAGAQSGAGTASAMSVEGPPSSVVVEVRDATLSPDSSLAGDIVKAKLSSAYLPGLRRCVKTLAETDATKTSSFVVTFAINETGVGVDAKATGVTKDAADCIAQQAAAWRFPIPRDADRKGMKVNATATFDISVDEESLRANRVDMLPGETMPAPDPESVLGLAVTIAKDELLLWSTTGLEGTLQKPQLRLPLASPDLVQKLTAQLEDIVKRRAKRDQDILVMAEPTTKMQLVAEVLGAVRATATGTALFPSVLLSVTSP